jgi:hypothetical protein
MITDKTVAGPPETNVVSFVATLKATIIASQEKERKLQAALGKTQAWSARWKELCHFLQGSKCDLALDIMEENENLVSLLTSLDSLLLNGTSVKLENGIIALLIEDMDRIAELTDVISGVKAAIIESTEIIARSFPIVPDVEVEQIETHLKLVKDDSEL